MDFRAEHGETVHAITLLAIELELDADWSERNLHDMLYRQANTNEHVRCDR